MVRLRPERPEFYIDTTETVEKFDQTGIRLVRRFAGVPVLQLSHTWSTCDDHTHNVSVLKVGAQSSLFTFVNWYLTQRRFPMSMTRAWLVHNIEEVAMLEHILPGAYADRADRADAVSPVTWPATNLLAATKWCDGQPPVSETTVEDTALLARVGEWGAANGLPALMRLRRHGVVWGPCGARAP